MSSYKMLDRKIEAAEGASNVVVTEIGQIGDNKMRVIIKSNAYKAQGMATVSRFDGQQWRMVARIIPEAMKTREGLIYRVKQPITNPSQPTPVAIGDFREDYAELIRQAELILG